jgi:hypothetical protein
MKNLKKETRKVANTGDYFSRIIQNVNNGYDYPEAIVVHNVNGGKWGNLRIYYHFSTIQGFELIGTVPSWAGSTDRSKYYHIIAILNSNIYRNLPVFDLQKYISQRK